MIDAEQAVADANVDLPDLRRQATLQLIELNTSIRAGSKAGRPYGGLIRLFVNKLFSV